MDYDIFICGNAPRLTPVHINFSPAKSCEIKNY